MAPSVYLDECVDQRLAPALRDRGYSVITASDAGTLGMTDEQQLRYANARDFLILSYNRRHFRRLHIRYAGSGEGHPGILLIPATTMLPRLIVRSAMMLDWIAEQGGHRSRLFEWGDFQYLLTQGFPIRGYSDHDLRLALGQTT